MVKKIERKESPLHVKALELDSEDIVRKESVMTCDELEGRNSSLRNLREVTGDKVSRTLSSIHQEDRLKAFDEEVLGV